MFAVTSYRVLFCAINSRSSAVGSAAVMCASSSSKFEERKIKQQLLLLGLSPLIGDHDLTSVRDAYLTLAKKYHPDVHRDSANSHKFDELKTAYANIRNYYTERAGSAESIQANDDDDELRIDHIAPQHRQYLSYEGVGHGTPSQRKQQYDKFRTDRAVENVFEHRKKSFLRETSNSALVKTEKEHCYTRRIKTRNLIQRVVEDLIQESMFNGEFEDLEGKGKPLKRGGDNPFIDSHEHKLNNVLINNGYAPEWMTLDTEIRSSYRKLEEEIQSAYNQHGPTHKLYHKAVNLFRENIKELNSKVDKLNMIVPSMRIQLAHYNADRTISKLQPAPATSGQTGTKTSRSN